MRQKQDVFLSVFAVALLAEGVDRNDTETGYMSEAMPSPSSRRAWIEIHTTTRGWQHWAVALLAEGVDRNTSCLPSPLKSDVALLAEGVDRNKRRCAEQPIRTLVALLAEGVDRNA